jgi:protein-S-isoprenylcysteine O-methyltransferase Ste14
MTTEPMAQVNPGDRSGVRIVPPLFYIAGLAAGFFVQRIWPVPIVSPAAMPPVLVAGQVLVTVCSALSLWALFTFWRSGTTPNPMRPTTALALDGPYRFTRNPMYVSLAAIQAGMALISNALWPLVSLLPVLVAVQWLVIDREERYLERRFGDSYLAYKRRVRRWL